MEKKLFLGLRVIIIILSLQAFIFIMAWGVPIFIFLIGNIGSPSIDAVTSQSRVTDLVFAAIATFFGIWCIIVAIWVSKLKKIGFNSAMVTLVISLLLSGLPISGVITSGVSQKWIGIVTFVLFFVIAYGSCLYYLTRPKVKEHFRQP